MQEVSVTANPEAGYRFTGWTGDLTSSDQSISITVDSNKTITANFELLDIFLDSNGVTLKVGPDIKVGEEIEYNGSTYTVVNIGTLKAMILNNLDVTKVITSRITDMSRLMFAVGNQSYSDAFNQDISSWDCLLYTSDACRRAI